MPRWEQSHLLEAGTVERMSTRQLAPHVGWVGTPLAKAYRADRVFLHGGCLSQVHDGEIRHSSGTLVPCFKLRLVLPRERSERSEADRMATPIGIAEWTDGRILEELPWLWSTPTLRKKLLLDHLVCPECRECHGCEGRAWSGFASVVHHRMPATNRVLELARSIGRLIHCKRCGYLGMP